MIVVFCNIISDGISRRQSFAFLSSNMRSPVKCGCADLRLCGSSKW